jgi:hypothetical protein
VAGALFVVLVYVEDTGEVCGRGWSPADIVLVR